MPAGPSELGFLYFAAAKFAGYTAYSRWAIQPQAENTGSTTKGPSAWKAGAARTLIGICAGVTVGLLFWKLPGISNGITATILFFAVLALVRIFEWWLLLKWLYRSFPLQHNQRNVLIGGGIVTSFVLDAVGIGAAFVLPGGMWVC